MEAIDLCDSDLEESVDLCLSRKRKDTIDVQNSFYTTGTYEDYNCLSRSDESNSNNSGLSLEDSYSKNEALQLKGINSGNDSSEPKIRKNTPCRKREVSEFTEPFKKQINQSLDRKRPREIQCANTKLALNQLNGYIELLDDTDEENSKISCESPISKKLFGSIQCTTATLDSTSSDSSSDGKTTSFSSHDLQLKRNTVFDQVKVKCHASRPQLGLSSHIVDLLSSGDEKVSDSSPQISCYSPRYLSLHKISNFQINATTTEALVNSSNHNSPVAIRHEEMKDLELTNGKKLKRRTCSSVCDSDSDDSSLLSPSCFARKPKPVKDVAKQVLSRFVQAKADMSNITSSKKKIGDLPDDSSLLSPSCFACKPLSTKNLIKQSRQERMNVSIMTSKSTASKIARVDPLSPIPNDGITNEKGISVLNTPNTPIRSREKIPTPRVPVRGIGGKLYPDFRHHFIKALLTHAKITRRAIHQRGVLDSSIRAVNIFSIYRFPIRTAEAGSRIKGIGNELLSVLRDAEKGKKAYNPPRGKFSSVAASALVGLLQYEEENSQGSLCSMEELITRINRLTHHNGSGSVLNRNTSYYLDKNTLDPGWMQVKKLGGNHTYAGLEAMIKERRKKDACQSGVVFELIAHGRKTALELKRTLEAGPLEAGPLRQLASDAVDEDFGNVTMSMDFREGGGSSKSLHKMCDLLDDYRVPYVVRNLKISDYVYFVGDKLAPVLIERKSVDDVACSLADGRWKRQQQSMRKAQYVLGNGAERRCQICYLIEGDATKRIVHGGKVGRVSWNCTLKDVEDAIAELPSLGFSVMKSRSHMGSMKILTQIARDVLWKYRNGSITCKYTYADFLKECKRCDSKEGDPPSLREHQYPAAPVVDSVPFRLDPSTSVGVVSNNIGIADNHNESSSHDAEQKAEDLKKLSISTLKNMCKDRDEKVSGNKKELIKRLLDKRKPEILITRARRDQYTPKVPSCNAAIIVALLLNHVPGTEGLSKEKIMLLAEETGVSKDPMGGNGGWYDGWASMKEMISGDPPLVCVSKRKYSLTTQPLGSSGLDVAKAIHTMAHRKKLCNCRQFIAM